MRPVPVPRVRRHAQARAVQPVLEPQQLQATIPALLRCATMMLVRQPMIPRSVSSKR